MRRIEIDLARDGYNIPWYSTAGSEEPPDVGSVGLLSKFILHQDKGCRLAPSCINCRFPECVEDNPRAFTAAFKTHRNQEIQRLFSREKLGTADIARRLGVSRRTVQRVLKPLLDR
jgi:hypothetical protein